MSHLKIYLILLLMTASLTGYSQEKWTATFRPDLNFLTTDLSNSNTKTGYGFEVTASYSVVTNLEIYTGWDWNQFKGDEFLAAGNSTFKVSGASFGLRYLHPISSTLRYNIMAGVILDKMKMETSSGDLIADSNSDLGWQLGTGITYIFGGNWQLQPEIRYRSFSTEITNTAFSEKITLNYLSFGIGLGVKF